MEFKRQNRNRLRLVDKGGLPVDTMYEQLRNDCGEAFFPAEITHQADQLERIAEVVESLKPVYENPYANSIGEAANLLTLDLMEYAAMADAAAPTIADRAADRDRAVKELERERERRAKQVEDLKAHYREQNERRRQGKLDRAARDKLLKLVKRVDRMRTTPQNRAKIEELIGALDTVSVGIREGTKLRLAELRRQAEAFHKRDPDWELSPRLLDEITRLDEKQIADLKIEDVEALTKTLLAIEEGVRSEAKLLRTQDRRDVYTQAVATVNSIRQAKAPGNVSGMKNKYLSAMLSPERYVRRLVGYDENSPLYRLTKDLTDGQRKAHDFQMRTDRYFDKWHSDKQFMKKLTGKDAKRIEVQGMLVEGDKLKTVKAQITPAQQVSLYLHAKHAANRAHLTDGGVTIPNADLYAKGKISEAFENSVRVVLDEDTLRRLTVNMDADVRAYANAVNGWFNGMAKDAINATSVTLDGYERAAVQGYFPIHTDPSFTRAEYEGVKFDATIEGWGSLKNRQGGRNPLILEDVTDVLDRHAKKTAQYYGIAIPVRNLNKLLNVTGTNSEWSVKEVLRQKWGSGAERYLNEMIADAQGARKGNQDVFSRAIASLRSKNAGAVLTLNSSVIMKQAASYPTAAGVLGWKPLLKALNPQAFFVDMNMIAQYTPDYWYRRKGYSTSELGDIVSRKKSTPKWVNLIQGVDLATTRTLWLASEYYVRDQNRGKANAPELRTDAYYKQVAEVYNRVIEETQPNYSSMQRPGILRTQNELTKSFVMFKTQSFQNFNMLYDAYGNWRAKARAYRFDRSDANREALKEARGNLSRNVSAQVVSAAVLSGMTFINALLLGRLANYKDDEEEAVTLVSALRQMGKDFASALAGMTLDGSEALSAMNALAFGDMWYDLDAGGVSSLNDTVSRVSSSAKAVQELFAVYQDEEQEITPALWQSISMKNWKLAKTLAEDFGGIPATNVERIVRAVADRVSRRAFGPYAGEYYNLLLLGADAYQDSGRYIDLLYKAYRAGSPDYGTLRGMMVDLGISEDKIDSGFQSRQKKTGEYQDTLARVTGDLQDALAGVPLYEENRAQANDYIKDYAKELAKTASDAGYETDDKWTQVISAAGGTGLEERDVLLYRLALKMADEDENGVTSQAEAQAALDMLAGLSERQKAYLFGSTNKAWKNNPYE
ncbi:hypothetical protein D3Z48_18030 [Clostridiaceae bacterium]|nr:hypothetical protein [Clostridiaceae bacterium]